MSGRPVLREAYERLFSARQPQTSRSRQTQLDFCYSTLAPDALIAGAQRSVSSLMNAPNSRGDIGVAFEPPTARRSCISVVASAR